VNELSEASQVVYAQLCAELFENTGIDPEHFLPHSLWSNKVTFAPAIANALAVVIPITPPPMIKQSLINTTF
jgi:LPS sulfotransferase NodH